MQLKICVDLCSIAILVTILTAFYMRNNIPLRQNRIFAALIWLTIVSTFTDLLGEIWQINPEVSMQYFPPYLHNIMNYVYFATRNLIPLCYLKYVISTLNIPGRKSALHLLYQYAPIMIIAVMLLMTPFTDAVFYIDAAGMYHRGVFLPVLYVISAYYLLLTVFFVVRYRKDIPDYRCAAFCLFVVLAFAGSAVQALVPFVSVEAFGVSICLLLIYMTIQRPEEILDGITGIFNRQAFFTVSSIALKSKVEFTVFLIVLDDLSFWMNSLGLETMNKLQKQIADYLSRYFKDTSAYKLSDRQFCLIINNQNDTAANHMMRRIQNRFSESWCVDDWHINLSAHYSMIQCPEHSDTPEGILSMIDMITDEAGPARDDVIEVSGLDVSSKQRFQTIDRLVNCAVEEGLLEVVYQPIYSIKENRFVSAEALMRLKHSELGNIPPSEFIPIAEKNGAIIKMDQFVRETVCRLIKEHDIRRFGMEYIEVNMSIVGCLQNDIMEKILGTLHKYGLDTGCINLEITETASDSIPEILEHNLKQLLEQGISFSLDDYGTGYSNMERMLEFPYHIIKIDKSLIQASFRSEAAYTVLAGTFRILKDLHRYVLAEGVETKEQAEKLIEMGCDFMQGYYYARPMSETDFLECIRQSAQSE